LTISASPDVDPDLQICDDRRLTCLPRFPRHPVTVRDRRVVEWNHHVRCLLPAVYLLTVTTVVHRPCCFSFPRAPRRVGACSSLVQKDGVYGVIPFEQFRLGCRCHAKLVGCRVNAVHAIRKTYIGTFPKLLNRPSIIIHSQVINGCRIAVFRWKLKRRKMDIYSS
jgi:hypothetical protein